MYSTFVQFQTLFHFKVTSKIYKKTNPLFNPPRTKMKSSLIWGRFTEIKSCTGLDIFVDMHQTFELQESKLSVA